MNKPFNFPFEYEIKEIEQYPTLCLTANIEIIIIPSYAKLYVIDFFSKLGILAVLEQDKDVIEYYGLKPRYIIKEKKDDNKD